MSSLSFWNEIQGGVEVAVASSLPDKLLGVRDAFRRYFVSGLDRHLPVAVTEHSEGEDRGGLCLSDEETAAAARDKARALRESLADTYHFYVACEGGIEALEGGGETLYFVRSWAVVTGVAGEALGASGSIEIPPRLLAGLEGHEIPFAVPGTRRRGGMIASLTGGLETRRSAVALATFNALATLFYGVIGRRAPAPRRWA